MDESSATARHGNAPKVAVVAARRPAVVPFPQSPRKQVPRHIVPPPYAASGTVPFSKFPEQILIHDDASAAKMRNAAQLARRVLDLACAHARPGITTDEVDTVVHQAIIANHAYPSPLNYVGFPKSLCSSVNEVICHGIPDGRPLQFGDAVSFDVSCYLDGVHGDNCATVIVGDQQEKDTGGGVDWRGVPYKMDFDSNEEKQQVEAARRLVHATRESLYAAIDKCRPGGCLSEIGGAIHDVADEYGYSTIEKYRGHGISDEFHCAPFVKHYRNDDTLMLVPGMIFTIEPMITEGTSECYEWSDEWTVVTKDGSLSAQFEHTVLITKNGVEILTLP